jgi:hypothetical protein
LKRNKVSTDFVQQKSPTADAEGLFDHQVEKRGGKSEKFEEDFMLFFITISDEGWGRLQLSPKK